MTAACSRTPKIEEMNKEKKKSSGAKLQRF